MGEITFLVEDAEEGGMWRALQAHRSSRMRMTWPHFTATFGKRFSVTLMNRIALRKFG